MFHLLAPCSPCCPCQWVYYNNVSGWLVDSQRRVQQACSVKNRYLLTCIVSRYHHLTEHTSPVHNAWMCVILGHVCAPCRLNRDKAVSVEYWTYYSHVSMVVIIVICELMKSVISQWMWLRELLQVFFIVCSIMGCTANFKLFEAECCKTYSNKLGLMNYTMYFSVSRWKIYAVFISNYLAITSMAASLR